MDDSFNVVKVMKHWPLGLSDISDNLVEPLGNGITGGKGCNICEYIGRPTAVRGVRKKQSGDKKRMGKMDALRALMSIAGDSWEKDLVMGSKNEAGAGNTGMLTGVMRLFDLVFYVDYVILKNLPSDPNNRCWGHKRHPFVS